MSTLISKKEINGSTYYRIHDVQGESIANLRCVKMIRPSVYEIVSNRKVEPELVAFLNERETIHLVPEEEAKEILGFLDKFRHRVRLTFINLLNCLDGVGALDNFIEVNGHYFATTQPEKDLNFLRLFKVVPASNGKILYHGGIHGEQDFPMLLGHWFDSQEKGKPIVYQLDNNNFYGVIRPDEDTVWSAMMERQEDGTIGARRSNIKTYRLEETTYKEEEIFAEEQFNNLLQLFASQMDLQTVALLEDEIVQKTFSIQEPNEEE